MSGSNKTLHQKIENFQTQILMSCKFKLENENLLLAIEMLQNEHETFETELVAETVKNQKCLRLLSCIYKIHPKKEHGFWE